jgi:hypothetical protein
VRLIAARIVGQVSNLTSGYKPDLPAASKTVTAILLLFCFVGLAACSEAQPEAGAIPAAEVALIDEEAVAPAPTEAAAVGPEQPMAGDEDVDECLRCHTDKEMLIDTAKPEEVVISENEGEG